VLGVTIALLLSFVLHMCMYSCLTVHLCEGFVDTHSVWVHLRFLFPWVEFALWMCWVVLEGSGGTPECRTEAPRGGGGLGDGATGQVGGGLGDGATGQVGGGLGDGATGQVGHTWRCLWQSKYICWKYHYIIISQAIQLKYRLNTTLVQLLNTYIVVADTFLSDWLAFTLNHIE